MLSRINGCFFVKNLEVNCYAIFRIRVTAAGSPVRFQKGEPVFLCEKSSEKKTGKVLLLFVGDDRKEEEVRYRTIERIASLGKPKGEGLNRYPDPSPISVRKAAHHTGMPASTTALCPSNKTPQRSVFTRKSCEKYRLSASC